MYDILSIAFCFFLWELGDIAIFERTEIRRQKTEAAQLASMKIMFSERFVDLPVDENVREEIIEGIIDDKPLK